MPVGLWTTRWIAAIAGHIIYLVNLLWGQWGFPRVVTCMVPLPLQNASSGLPACSVDNPIV
jgi:hypothetical protein